MTKDKVRVEIKDLDKVKDIVTSVVLDAPRHPNLRYADLRVEASEGIGSYSEDGNPKVTSKDWGLSFGVRVIVGSKLSAAGYFGTQLGLSSLKNFSKILQSGFSIAYERARANSKYKAKFRDDLGQFGKSLHSTELAPIEVNKKTIKAKYQIDPRSIASKEITEFTCSSALAAKNLHPNVKKVEVVVNSVISRQIFASSEGTLIDQSFCATGGTVFVVAQNDKGDRPADLYHHTGNQLGFEALAKGRNVHEKTMEEFCKQIAQEAVLLSNAPPAPETDEATVVLDPDLIALFAHEIIGHPSELDRALKMEAGYAGRSWFLTDLKNSMVGKRVSSSLLTAFSDPTLEGGYGSYLYDDEGTPAKRVYHMRGGIYQDFMNSRQTAAIFGSKPNGHFKANDASVVPLIRMSVSAIEGGNDNPKRIISEVEDGYYCIGHRIPSISESRENFQIAPRLIYEIKNGEIGQVYRDGRVTADSKDFFMSIDALGDDFKVFPIPNCGKGQPMQTKMVGNGGPTARARAKIARG